MQKYNIGSILLITLLIIRFIVNGFLFTSSQFDLRLLLFILLYTASAMGALFSKRWSYLLGEGTAISEFSVTAVLTSGAALDFGTLATDALIVIFSVWGLYKSAKRPSRRRRR